MAERKQRRIESKSLQERRLKENKRDDNGFFRGGRANVGEKSSKAGSSG
jgi:hypothetical protein